MEEPPCPNIARIAPADRPSAKTAKLRKRLGVVLGSLLLVTLCATIRYYWGAQPARAGTSEVAVSSAGQEASVAVRDPRPSSPAPAPAAQAGSRPGSSLVPEDAPIPAIVATVNTQRITREDLARECRRSLRQGSAREHGQQAFDRRGVPAARNDCHAGRKWTPKSSAWPSGSTFPSTSG